MQIPLKNEKLFKECPEITSMKSVPKSLRAWFIVHFFVDILFALPLIFAPEWTLKLMGFEVIDVFGARFVGAALFAIGAMSVIKNKAGPETYDVMLTLKILWGCTASFGILLSYDHWPKMGGMILSGFIFFPVLWIYYKYSAR